jgi:hypothetical protein
LLKNHAQSSPQKGNVLGFDLIDLKSCHYDTALTGLQVCIQEPEQRGFSAARFSNEIDKLSGEYIKTHLAQNSLISQSERYGAQTNYWLYHQRVLCKDINASKLSQTFSQLTEYDLAFLKKAPNLYELCQIWVKAKPKRIFCWASKTVILCQDFGFQ